MHELPPETIRDAIQRAARTMRLGHVPIDRLVYTRWLTTTDALPVVIVNLDMADLEKPSARLLGRDMRHEIGTHLGGVLVLPSNHSGARYVIFLRKPRLPETVPCPENLPAQTFALGVTIDEHLHLPVARMQNVLAGGAPGSGKSTFLHLLAGQAAGKGYRLFLADPQENTFAPGAWEGLAALPVASSPAAFQALLESLLEIFAERSVQFAAQTPVCPDIETYNRTAEEPLPRLMLLVDEANTFLVDKTIQNKLADVARQGRKYGLTVVLAAHDWRAASISKGLSANFTTRLTFRVDDATSGQVVLLSPKLGKAAMNLRHPGRGIGRFPGYGIRLFQACLPPEMPSGVRDASAPLLTRREREILEHIRAHGGKATLEVLQAYGLGQREARRLQAAWLERGLLVRDPMQGNACVLAAEWHAGVLPDKPDKADKADKA